MVIVTLVFLGTKIMFSADQLHLNNCVKNLKSYILYMVSGIMTPGKKFPEKLIPQKFFPRKLYPRKKFPGKLSPRNCFPSFLLLLTLSYSFTFKLFIVINFRGVSRTPAKSIIGLLVVLVNGIQFTALTNVAKNLHSRRQGGRRLSSQFIT